jgi:hypothetical protein
VLELDPKKAAACLIKAVDCELLGRRQEAIEAYEEFIRNAPPEYAPDSTLARERLRALSRSAE